MSSFILAADADRDLVNEFRAALTTPAVHVLTAVCAGDALARAVAWSPTAAIVGTAFGDETVPLIRDLHRDSDVRILVAARPGDEALVLAALEAGAVGFVPLPVPKRELAARVFETLRWHDAETGRYLSVGPITLDLEKRAILRPRPTAVLTPCEFEILRWLLTPPGRTYTRRQLLAADRAAFPPDATERHVDRHVVSLVQKLGEAGAAIEPTAELGWRFAAERTPGIAAEFPLTNINYEL